MPKGGTGRHWRQTPSGGKDAARCAVGEGRTAIRSIATVPLCRQHAGACRNALGPSPSAAQVRAWVEQQQRAPAAEEPAPPAEEEQATPSVG